MKPEDRKMTIGPPPKTITLLGKEYFEAESMNQHLRDLRAALARCEMRYFDECKQKDHWKLIASNRGETSE